MDISQRTGQYLHGPDDIFHLSFPTVGVPRSFSVIVYSAVELEVMDLSRDGIAVVDNDRMTVVLDGHLRGNPTEQAAFIDQARDMDWKTFSGFCIGHSRFRDGSPDLHSDRPDPGVLTNQIHRGVVDEPASRDDLRTPNMIKADKDAACPYSFPAATRRRMISDILDHHMARDGLDKWRLAWQATISEELAREGQVRGDKSHDGAWTSHYSDHPEAFHQAQVAALEDFLTGNIGTWPKSDVGRYEFAMTSAGNDADIYLDRIDGAEIAFGNKAEIGVFLDQLGDSGIRDIWKLVRVLDQDLSPGSLESAFRARLTEVRAQFEETFDETPEPSLQ